MNNFIKEAITDRLRELAEEKEAIDSKISETEKTLKVMKEKQEVMGRIIEETVAFLNESKKTEKSTKIKKSR